MILLAAVYNILNAWHDAKRIERQKRIYHGLNAGLYLVFSAGITWYSGCDLYLFVTLLLSRKLIFDLSLNLFRGLPLFYFSRKTGSIIDKWTLKVVGNNMILLYALITAAIIILNLLK